MTETLEHTARKIAERGRDALVARLRPAFEQAAATHGEGLDLGDEQLERMIQRAADRADGLQWRRALAQVATEQLGIGLGEALSHPAVARAQAIVGAPSYEDALGELGASRPAAAAAGEARAAEAEPETETEAEPEAKAEPETETETETQAEPETKAEPEPKAAAAEEPEHAAEPEPAPGAEATPDEAAAANDDEAEDAAQAEEPGTEAVAPVGGAAPAGASPPADVTAEHPSAPDEAPEPAPAPAGDPGTVRLRAIHLGGIANLAPAEGDLELHLSDAGLDIMRGPERSPLGRLTWDEIVALETPVVGGRFRRKKGADAHLVVRSAQGSASFEVPGVTTEELSDHLAPMLARHNK